MPWLMLGAGAIIQMEAEVQMQIDTDLEGNSVNESFDQVADTVITPTAGVLVPWEEWAFGVTWRMASQGQIGPINADTLAIVGGSDLATLPLQVSFRDSYIPMQLAAGAQWKPLPELLVALDMTWMQWSGFEKFAEEEDDARKDVELEFTDTFVPRLGAEYVVNGVHAFRAGYSYEMTPVEGIGTYRPFEDLNVVGFVILDNDKHVGSLGYGYTLSSISALKYPVHFDLGLQMQYLTPQTEETSDGVEYTSEGVLFAGAFNVSLGF
jgi:long-subunit fatty acid transport protein